MAEARSKDKVDGPRSLPEWVVCFHANLREGLDSRHLHPRSLSNLSFEPRWLPRLARIMDSPCSWHLKDPAYSGDEARNRGWYESRH